MPQLTSDFSLSRIEKIMCNQWDLKYLREFNKHISQNFIYCSNGEGKGGSVSLNHFIHERPPLQIFSNGL